MTDEEFITELTRRVRAGEFRLVVKHPTEGEDDIETVAATVSPDRRIIYGQGAGIGEPSRQ